MELFLLAPLMVQTAPFDELEIAYKWINDVGLQCINASVEYPDEPPFEIARKAICLGFVSHQVWDDVQMSRFSTLLNQEQGRLKCRQLSQEILNKYDFCSNFTLQSSCRKAIVNRLVDLHDIQPDPTLTDVQRISDEAANGLGLPVGLKATVERDARSFSNPRFLNTLGIVADVRSDTLFKKARKAITKSLVKKQQHFLQMSKSWDEKMIQVLELVNSLPLPTLVKDDVVLEAMGHINSKAGREVFTCAECDVYKVLCAFASGTYSCQ